MLRTQAICKRVLIVFLLALVLNSAGCAWMPMYSGFTAPVGALVEEYFYDQNSLGEAEEYVKAELKQAQVLSPKESFCRIPAFVWPDSTIVRVEPSAGKSGLRRGDQILKVDGEAETDWKGLVPMVVKHEPDEEVDLTLLRNGVELQQKIKCLDGQVLRNKWMAALEAASKGRWRECVVLSDEIDRLPLIRFSGIALLRYHCSEGDRIVSDQIPTGNDAMLLYEARMRQLEEAKYVQGGMEKIKPEVLNAIYWLERNRFRPFAAALTEELEKRTSR